MRTSLSGRMLHIIFSIIFLFNQVFSEPAMVLAQMNPWARSLPPGFGQLSLPEDLGAVEDSFRGRSSAEVVILKDAHAVADAQYSIAKMLRRFGTEHGLDWVGAEGAAGPFQTLLFETFPDPAALKKTLDRLTSQGEFSGAALAALSEPLPAPFEGLEDNDLYQEQLDAYFSAVNRRAELEKSLGDIQARLQAAKDRFYSPAARDWDAKLSAFRNKKSDAASLTGALKEMARLLPAFSNKYPHLSAAWNELRTNGKSSPKAGAILRNWKRSIETKSRAARQDPAFNAQAQAWMTGALSDSAYAAYLESYARRELGLEAPEAAKGLALTGRLLAKAQANAWIREWKEAARETGGRIFRSADEKDVAAISEQLDRWQDCIRLEIIPEDWTALRSKTPHPSLSLRERTKVRGNGKSTPSLVEKNPAEQIQALADALEDLDGALRSEACSRFYEIAGRRDDVFVQKVESAFKSGKKRAAIVVGGFHADDLASALKKKKISYTLVTPAIASLSGAEGYDRLMRGDVSWKSFFKVEDGRVKVYESFAAAMVHELLGLEKNKKTPQKDLPLFRAWRENLVRRAFDPARSNDALEALNLLDGEVLNAFYGEEYRDLRDKALAKIDPKTPFKDTRSVFQMAAGLSANAWTALPIGTLTVEPGAGEVRILEERGSGTETPLPAGTAPGDEDRKKSEFRSPVPLVMQGLTRTGLQGMHAVITALLTHMVTHGGEASLSFDEIRDSYLALLRERSINRNRYDPVRQMAPLAAEMMGMESYLVPQFEPLAEKTAVRILRNALTRLRRGDRPLLIADGKRYKPTNPRELAVLVGHLDFLQNDLRVILGIPYGTKELSDDAFREEMERYEALAALETLSPMRGASVILHAVALMQPDDRRRLQTRLEDLKILTPLATNIIAMGREGGNDPVGWLRQHTIRELERDPDAVELSVRDSSPEHKPNTAMRAFAVLFRDRIRIVVVNNRPGPESAGPWAIVGLDLPGQPIEQSLGGLLERARLRWFKVLEVREAATGRFFRAETAMNLLGHGLPVYLHPGPDTSPGPGDPWQVLDLPFKRSTEDSKVDPRRHRETFKDRLPRLFQMFPFVMGESWGRKVAQKFHLRSELRTPKEELLEIVDAMSRAVSDGPFRPPSKIMLQRSFFQISTRLATEVSDKFDPSEQPGEDFLIGTIPLSSEIDEKAEILTRAAQSLEIFGSPESIPSLREHFSRVEIVPSPEDPLVLQLILRRRQTRITEAAVLPGQTGILREVVAHRLAGLNWRIGDPITLTLLRLIEYILNGFFSFPWEKRFRLLIAEERVSVRVAGSVRIADLEPDQAGAYDYYVLAQQDGQAPHYIKFEPAIDALSVGPAEKNGVQTVTVPVNTTLNFSALFPGRPLDHTFVVRVLAVKHGEPPTQEAPGAAVSPKFRFVPLRPPEVLVNAGRRPGSVWVRGRDIALPSELAAGEVFHTGHDLLIQYRPSGADGRVAWSEPQRVLPRDLSATRTRLEREGALVTVLSFSGVELHPGQDFPYDHGNFDIRIIARNRSTGAEIASFAVPNAFHADPKPEEVAIPSASLERSGNLVEGTFELQGITSDRELEQYDVFIEYQGERRTVTGTRMLRQRAIFGRSFLPGRSRPASGSPLTRMKMPSDRVKVLFGADGTTRVTLNPIDLGTSPTAANIVLLRKNGSAMASLKVPVAVQRDLDLTPTATVAAGKAALSITRPGIRLYDPEVKGEQRFLTGHIFVAGGRLPPGSVISVAVRTHGQGGWAEQNIPAGDLKIPENQDGFDTTYVYFRLRDAENLFPPEGGACDVRISVNHPSAQGALAQTVIENAFELPETSHVETHQMPRESAAPPKSWFPQPLGLAIEAARSRPISREGTLWAAGTAGLAGIGTAAASTEPVSDVEPQQVKPPPPAVDAEANWREGSLDLRVTAQSETLDLSKTEIYVVCRHIDEKGDVIPSEEEPVRFRIPAAPNRHAAGLAYTIPSGSLSDFDDDTDYPGQKRLQAEIEVVRKGDEVLNVRGDAAPSTLAPGFHSWPLRLGLSPVGITVHYRAPANKRRPSSRVIRRKTSKQGVRSVRFRMSRRPKQNERGRAGTLPTPAVAAATAGPVGVTADEEESPFLRALVHGIPPPEDNSAAEAPFAITDLAADVDSEGGSRRLTGSFTATGLSPDSTPIVVVGIKPSNEPSGKNESWRWRKASATVARKGERFEFIVDRAHPLLPPEGGPCDVRIWVTDPHTGKTVEAVAANAFKLPVPTTSEAAPQPKQENPSGGPVQHPLGSPNPLMKLIEKLLASLLDIRFPALNGRTLRDLGAGLKPFHFPNLQPDGRFLIGTLRVPEEALNGALRSDLPEGKNDLSLDGVTFEALVGTAFGSAAVERDEAATQKDPGFIVYNIYLDPAPAKWLRVRPLPEPERPVLTPQQILNTALPAHRFDGINSVSARLGEDHETDRTLAQLGRVNLLPTAQWSDSGRSAAIGTITAHEGQGELLERAARERLFFFLPHVIPASDGQFRLNLIPTTDRPGVYTLRLQVLDALAWTDPGRDEDLPDHYARTLPEHIFREPPLTLIHYFNYLLAALLGMPKEDKPEYIKQLLVAIEEAPGNERPALIDAFRNAIARISPDLLPEHMEERLAALGAERAELPAELAASPAPEPEAMPDGVVDDLRELFAHLLMGESGTALRDAADFAYDAQPQPEEGEEGDRVAVGTITLRSGEGIDPATTEQAREFLDAAASDEAGLELGDRANQHPHLTATFRPNIYFRQSGPGQYQIILRYNEASLARRVAPGTGPDRPLKAGGAGGFRAAPPSSLPAESATPDTITATTGPNGTIHLQGVVVHGKGMLTEDRPLFTSADSEEYTLTVGWRPIGRPDEPWFPSSATLSSITRDSETENLTFTFEAQIPAGEFARPERLSGTGLYETNVVIRHKSTNRTVYSQPRFTIVIETEENALSWRQRLGGRGRYERFLERIQVLSHPEERLGAAVTGPEGAIHPLDTPTVSAAAATGVVRITEATIGLTPPTDESGIWRGRIVFNGTVTNTNPDELSDGDQFRANHRVLYRTRPRGSTESWSSPVAVEPENTASALGENNEGNVHFEAGFNVQHPETGVLEYDVQVVIVPATTPAAEHEAAFSASEPWQGWFAVYAPNYKPAATPVKITGFEYFKAAPAAQGTSVNVDLTLRVEGSQRDPFALERGEYALYLQHLPPGGGPGEWVEVPIVQRHVKKFGTKPGVYTVKVPTTHFSLIRPGEHHIQAVIRPKRSKETVDFSNGPLKLGFTLSEPEPSETAEPPAPPKPDPADATVIRIAYNENSFGGDPIHVDADATDTAVSEGAADDAMVMSLIHGSTPKDNAAREAVGKAISDAKDAFKQATTPEEKHRTWQEFTRIILGGYPIPISVEGKPSIYAVPPVTREMIREHAGKHAIIPNFLYALELVRRNLNGPDRPIILTVLTRTEESITAAFFERRDIQEILGNAGVMEVRIIGTRAGGRSLVVKRDVVSPTPERPFLGDGKEATTEFQGLSAPAFINVQALSKEEIRAAQEVIRNRSAAADPAVAVPDPEGQVKPPAVPIVAGIVINQPVIEVTAINGSEATVQGSFEIPALIGFKPLEGYAFSFEYWPAENPDQTRRVEFSVNPLDAAPPLQPTLANAADVRPSFSNVHITLPGAGNYMGRIVLIPTEAAAAQRPRIESSARLFTFTPPAQETAVPPAAAREITPRGNEELRASQVLEAPGQFRIDGRVALQGLTSRDLKNELLAGHTVYFEYGPEEGSKTTRVEIPANNLGVHRWGDGTTRLTIGDDPEHPGTPFMISPASVFPGFDQLTGRFVLVRKTPGAGAAAEVASALVPFPVRIASQPGEVLGTAGFSIIPTIGQFVKGAPATIAENVHARFLINAPLVAVNPDDFDYALELAPETGEQHTVLLSLAGSQRWEAMIEGRRHLQFSAQILPTAYLNASGTFRARLIVIPRDQMPAPTERLGPGPLTEVITLPEGTIRAEAGEGTTFIVTKFKETPGAEAAPEPTSFLAALLQGIAPPVLAGQVAAAGSVAAGAELVGEVAQRVEAAKIPIPAAEALGELFQTAALQGLGATQASPELLSTGMIFVGTVPVASFSSIGDPPTPEEIKHALAAIRLAGGAAKSPNAKAVVDRAEKAASERHDRLDAIAALPADIAGLQGNFQRIQLVRSGIHPHLYDICLVPRTAAPAETAGRHGDDLLHHEVDLVRARLKVKHEKSAPDTPAAERKPDEIRLKLTLPVRTPESLAALAQADFHLGVHWGRYGKPEEGFEWQRNFFDGTGSAPTTITYAGSEEIGWVATLEKVIPLTGRLHRFDGITGGKLVVEDRSDTKERSEFREIWPEGEDLILDVQASDDRYGNSMGAVEPDDLLLFGVHDRDPYDGKFYPDWLVMRIAAQVVLDLTDGGRSCTTEQIITELQRRLMNIGFSEERRQPVFKRYTRDFLRERILDRLVDTFGLLSRTGVRTNDAQSSYAAAVDRRALAVQVSHVAYIRHELEPKLDAYIADPSPEGNAATELGDVIRAYAEATSHWPLYPVEAKYPVLKAVAMMDRWDVGKPRGKRKVDFLKKFLAANREITRLPLGDAIAGMLDPEAEVDHWLDDHAANLKGATIYYISPETWLAAGGLGRVGQFLLSRAKQLVQIVEKTKAVAEAVRAKVFGLRLVSIEPRYQGVNYKNVAVPVEKMQREKGLDFKMLVTRRRKDGQGRLIPTREWVNVQVWSGTNAYGVEVFFFSDTEGYYVGKLYQYDDDQNPTGDLASWEEFTEFLSKGSVKLAKQLEKRQRDDCAKSEKKFVDGVLWGNDGQCGAMPAFKRLSDEIDRLSAADREKLGQMTEAEWQEWQDAQDHPERYPGRKFPEYYKYYQVRDLITDPETEASLADADTHSTGHTYRNQGFRFLSFVLNMGLPKHFHRFFLMFWNWREPWHKGRVNATSGMMRLSDSMNGVSAIQAQEGLSPYNPGCRIAGIANGDLRSATRKELREIFKDRKFRARFPPGEVFDPEYPTPEQIVAANDFAIERFRANKDLLKLNPRLAGLNTKLPTGGYAGRLVIEKFVSDKDLLRKLVAAGAQFVVFGNIQKGDPHSKAMYDELEELGKQFEREGLKGKLIVVSGWDIPKQRKFFVIEWFHYLWSLRDKFRGTEAAGLTETDAPAVGALLFTSAFLEAIFQTSNEPLNYADLEDSGTMVIPKDDTFESAEQALLQMVDEMADAEGSAEKRLRFAERQITSIHMSRILEVRMTAAAYFRELSLSRARKQDPVGLLERHLRNQKDKEPRYFRGEWLRQGLELKLEEQGAARFGTENAAVQAFAAKLNGSERSRIVLVERGDREGEDPYANPSSVISDGANSAFARILTHELKFAPDSQAEIEIQDAVTHEPLGRHTVQALFKHGLAVSTPFNMRIRVLDLVPVAAAKTTPPVPARTELQAAQPEPLRINATLTAAQAQVMTEDAPYPGITTRNDLRGGLPRTIAFFHQELLALERFQHQGEASATAPPPTDIAAQQERLLRLAGIVPSQAAAQPEVRQNLFEYISDALGKLNLQAEAARVRALGERAVEAKELKDQIAPLAEAIGALDEWLLRSAGQHLQAYLSADAGRRGDLEDMLAPGGWGQYWSGYFARVRDAQATAEQPLDLPPVVSQLMHIASHPDDGEAVEHFRRAIASGLDRSSRHRSLFSQTLQPLAGLNADAARFLFGGEQGRRTALALAALAPDVLRQLALWDPALFSQIVKLSKFAGAQFMNPDQGAVQSVFLIPSPHPGVFIFGIRLQDNTVAILALNLTPGSGPEVQDGRLPVTLDAQTIFNFRDTARDQRNGLFPPFANYTIVDGLPSVAEGREVTAGPLAINADLHTMPSLDVSIPADQGMRVLILKPVKSEAPAGAPTSLPSPQPLPQGTLGAPGPRPVAAAAIRRTTARATGHSISISKALQVKPQSDSSGNYQLTGTLAITLPLTVNDLSGHRLRIIAPELGHTGDVSSTITARVTNHVAAYSLDESANPADTAWGSPVTVKIQLMQPVPGSDGFTVAAEVEQTISLPPKPKVEKRSDLRMRGTSQAAVTIAQGIEALLSEEELAGRPKRSDFRHRAPASAIAIPFVGSGNAAVSLHRIHGDTPSGVVVQGNFAAALRPYRSEVREQIEIFEKSTRAYLEAHRDATVNLGFVIPYDQSIAEDLVLVAQSIERLQQAFGDRVQNHLFVMMTPAQMADPGGTAFANGIRPLGAKAEVVTTAGQVTDALESGTVFAYGIEFLEGIPIDGIPRNLQHLVVSTNQFSRQILPSIVGGAVELMDRYKAEGTISEKTLQQIPDDLRDFFRKSNYGGWMIVEAFLRAQWQEIAGLRAMASAA